MFRALLYTLLALFVISVLRLIIGTLSRGVGELFQEEAAAKKKTPGAPPPAAGGGVLKRDPVCGAYVPLENSVRRTVAGEVLYFCSSECRDKYSV